MFNPIQWYKSMQLDKLQIKIEMFSSLIHDKFMCNDYGLNADGYWEKDFTWRTENYKFVHKEVDWDWKPQLVWIVVPKTVDNHRDLRHLHHGQHPSDWIVKTARMNYFSYPPERLQGEILKELKDDLLSRPKNPNLFGKKVITVDTEPEGVESRFDILDL